MHQHPDSIVIPLVESKVRFTLPDGKSEDSTLANESAQYSAAGTHNPANVGTNPIDALLVEFKAPAPGKAALPSSRPGMDLKVLAEGPRATAYRSTASATFAEPAGTTHEFDQVVSRSRLVRRCRSPSMANLPKQPGLGATLNSSVVE